MLCFCSSSPQKTRLKFFCSNLNRMNTEAMLMVLRVKKKHMLESIFCSGRELENCRRSISSFKKNALHLKITLAILYDQANAKKLLSASLDVQVAVTTQRFFIVAPQGKLFLEKSPGNIFFDNFRQRNCSGISVRNGNWHFIPLRYILIYGLL